MGLCAKAFPYMDLARFNFKIALSGFLNDGYTGLPLFHEKNLINLDFSAVGYAKKALIHLPRIHFYTLNNQIFRGYIIRTKSRFSCFEKLRSLFEFNRPILEKEQRILKDFGKNGTNFEGFRRDFESIEG